jgi:protease II
MLPRHEIEARGEPMAVHFVEIVPRRGPATVQDHGRIRRSEAPALLGALLILSACAAPGAETRAMAQVEGNLVLDGVPEVPPDVVERVRPYLETRSADVRGISTDGTKLLVTTRFGETAQLHWVASPMGARTQLTFAADPIGLGALVPGNDRTILYLSDRGGDENYQIHRMALDAETVRLTDGKSRHPEMALSLDGERVAFNGNARNGRDMDIYVAAARGGSTPDLFLERQGHWAPLAWSRDGTELLLRHYVSIADSPLYAASLATKQVERVTPEAPAGYRDAAFGERTLYVTSDREGDRVELYALDRAAKTWTPLSRHVPWNVEQIEISGDAKTLAYVTNEDGYSVLRLLDLAARKEVIVSDLPRGVISTILFARDAPVLAIGLSSPTRTNDAYTYDLARRTLTRWTESELGGLDARRFVEPTLERYRSFDGEEIPVFTYLPEGPGPFPLIIDIHGGPEAQARPWFLPLTQLLVASGYAVMIPNVRGSDGYGKRYLGLDDGMQRMGAVKDIGALLDFAAGRPDIDRARVGVFGGSYGGFMVLASLAEYPERIRAGVEIVGISSFVTFLENTSEYRRDLRRVEYGDERDPKMRAFLESISPATNAHRISSALFVAQGANDPRVPASESLQIVEKVRAAGHPVWSMLAKNEGHGFRFKENRTRFALLTLLFFQQHL